MTDRGDPLVLDSQDASGHFMYVDNIGILTRNRDHAKQALDDARRDFEKDRLVLHEIGVHEAGGRALGWDVDGRELCTRASPERFGLVRQAVKALLSRRKVSGWQVEALLGHATFVCLLRRETLSIFHTVYRFIASCYHKFEPLWDGTRAELESFVGLMVFIEADWTRPWMPVVYASDASLSGYGVSESVWAKESVAEVGRVPEVQRWRLGAVPARRHAFECAGFQVDPESGEIARDPFGQAVRLDTEIQELIRAERWESNPEFREVLSSLLHSSKWQTVMADRWIYPDNILRLEARGMVKAASRAAHCAPMHDCRILLLGDNLGVILCFARSRAREFGFLVQVRRLCAFGLSRNIRFAVRWVPSEFNSGDEGSHKYETSYDPTKSLTSQLGPPVPSAEIPLSCLRDGLGMSGESLPATSRISTNSLGLTGREGDPDVLEGVSVNPMIRTNQLGLTGRTGNADVLEDADVSGSADCASGAGVSDSAGLVQDNDEPGFGRRQRRRQVAIGASDAGDEKYVFHDISGASDQKYVSSGLSDARWDAGKGGCVGGATPEPETPPLAVDPSGPRCHDHPIATPALLDSSCRAPGAGRALSQSGAIRCEQPGAGEREACSGEEASESVKSLTSARISTVETSGGAEGNEFGRSPKSLRRSRSSPRNSMCWSSSR